MTELKEQEAKQEPIKAPEELKAATPEPQASEEKASEPSDVDPNWKAFREARKKDRADREAAERKAAEKEAEVAALKAAMEAAFSKPQPSPQAYQQYYGMNQETEETEEEILERKVEKLLAAKEEKQRREQAEREAREYPNRLTRDFPDINSVCSQENIDYLDFHYPEIARPLGRLQEGYDKWHDIYHAIKKLIPNQKHAQKDAKNAEINQMKPKSISSPTTISNGGQGQDSWRDIEARRQANYERMRRTMKSA